MTLIRSGPIGPLIEIGSGGGGLPESIADRSVNSARTDGQSDGSIVLRTGSPVNPAGAYVGGGTGNKAIAGALTQERPLGELTSIEYDWTNVVGPGGPFFLPPGAGTVTTPYVNVIVDFDPLGAGDLRILVMCDDSLAAAITASIGTYLNDGANLLTYAWTAAQNVLIVGAPPAAVPGGVAPSVSVGPSWPENSYSFAALVAANPTARIVEAFPADGGLPSGAVMPGVNLVSGDSGNVVKSGKRIRRWEINGIDLVG